MSQYIVNIQFQYCKISEVATGIWGAYPIRRKWCLHDIPCTGSREH